MCLRTDITILSDKVHLSVEYIHIHANIYILYIHIYIYIYIYIYIALKYFKGFQTKKATGLELKFLC